MENVMHLPALDAIEQPQLRDRSPLWAFEGPELSILDKRVYDIYNDCGGDNQRGHTRRREVTECACRSHGCAATRMQVIEATNNISLVVPESLGKCQIVELTSCRPKNCICFYLTDYVTADMIRSTGSLQAGGRASVRGAVRWATTLHQTPRQKCSGVGPSFRSAGLQELD